MCGHTHFGINHRLCNNLLANTICCLLHVVNSMCRMVVYTAVCTPYDSKDKISKRIEFALLVESSWSSC
jgi:hypothetical protein